MHPIILAGTVLACIYAVFACIAVQDWGEKLVAWIIGLVIALPCWAVLCTLFG